MAVTCPYLSAQPGIKHGFFTRNGGISTGLYTSLNCGYGSGDELEHVTQNRQLVAQALGTTHESLCTAYQIHSADAVTLTTPWHWKDAPQADALVTATPGIALGILTADCLPVLLADSSHGVIGATHAGWKGAYSGVLEATLATMQQLGAKSSSIIATLGPAIAKPSYEVGPEFYERFIEQSTENNAYFIPSARPDHHLFDLKAYAASRLRQAGISQINILAHDTCLQVNDFFSFRRTTQRGEPVYGRQISAIMLENK